MLLTIIRHAQAGGDYPDHERSLTMLGKTQAHELGRKLRELYQLQANQLPDQLAQLESGAAGKAPTVLIHSDARRTTQTAQLLELGCKEIGLSELYGAWIPESLQLLKEYGEDATVLVGHEPLVSGLGAWLTDAESLRHGVGTATAIIAAGELAQGGMRLITVIRPQLG